MTTDHNNGYSVSPANERFPLPTREDYAGEFARVKKLAHVARDEGKEVVVVMGLGFVGAVMAAIVADRPTSAAGRQVRHRLQRPSPRSYWKIPLLNRGIRRSRPKTPKST